MIFYSGFGLKVLKLSEIWGSETVEGFVCVNSEGQFGLKWEPYFRSTSLISSLALKRKLF